MSITYPFGGMDLTVLIQLTYDTVSCPLSRLCVLCWHLALTHHTPISMEEERFTHLVFFIIRQHTVVHFISSFTPVFFFFVSGLVWFFHLFIFDIWLIRVLLPRFLFASLVRRLIASSASSLTSTFSSCAFFAVQKQKNLKNLSLIFVVCWWMVVRIIRVIIFVAVHLHQSLFLFCLLISIAARLLPPLALFPFVFVRLSVHFSSHPCMLYRPRNQCGRSSSIVLYISFDRCICWRMGKCSK